MMTTTMRKKPFGADAASSRSLEPFVRAKKNVEKEGKRMWIVSVPRVVSQAAVHQLALVDYNIANRVTEDVATIVTWAYAHDMPALATASVKLLQTFDDLGSLFISIAVWLVMHTN